MYHSVSTGIYSNTGHLTFTEFKQGISHVPSLVREVTALVCDV